MQTSGSGLGIVAVDPPAGRASLEAHDQRKEAKQMAAIRVFVTMAPQHTWKGCSCLPRRTAWSAKLHQSVPTSLYYTCPANDSSSPQKLGNGRNHYSKGTGTFFRNCRRPGNECCQRESLRQSGRVPHAVALEEPQSASSRRQVQLEEARKRSLHPIITGAAPRTWVAKQLYPSLGERVHDGVAHRLTIGGLSPHRKPTARHRHLRVAQLRAARAA